MIYVLALRQPESIQVIASHRYAFATKQIKNRNRVHLLWGILHIKMMLDITICPITKFVKRMRIAHIGITHHKNIERHTAHTIVSWPNPKQWVIVHTSKLMMIMRQSMYILSIIKKEMGKLKTHSPKYCIMDNWENMLNLTHTHDKLYLTGIL